MNTNFLSKAAACLAAALALSPGGTASGASLAELVGLHAGIPLASAATTAPPDAVDCPALLRHAFVPIQGGAPQTLCRYRGQVLLIVNTASQCGYTPQYEKLEALHRKYRERGLVVIGFPSNDFGGQEPGSNKDIAEFCRTVYGVQFPMYEKQSVTRLAENPLYADLVARTRAAPRWNFHKYVVDRSGTAVTSHASDVQPDDRSFVQHLERLLAERPPGSRP
jgi:glutathione peroxidase